MCGTKWHISEPYDDGTVFAVHPKSDVGCLLDEFECDVVNIALLVQTASIAESKRHVSRV